VLTHIAITGTLRA